ncbi:MAG: arginine--tRNA ligase [Bdellovibrionales bacterium]
MLTELKAKVGTALQGAGHDSKALLPLLEAPKRPGQGHLALPIFALAKSQGQPPPLFAANLAKTLNDKNTDMDLAKVEAIQGFVNFHFTPRFVQNILMKAVHGAAPLGSSVRGQGKTMVIDFSSPNVAKPMHVGHLRATVIGQAIVNLAQSQGYKVVGLNHLGDWGVQFGNLAWAYQNWGKEYPFDEKPFESLYQLYVRFHQAAETDSALAKVGAETFRRLEDGDPQITKIWRMVVDISLKEYARLWKMLGVKHDLVRGESFYNDRLKGVEQLLEKKGLLVESDGAMVVRLDDEGMAPCLIRKTDGASLYATRDLASAIYRHDELRADLNLYVVGAEQTLHFRQVFSVLKRLGYNWADGCHHISFGMYRFKDIGKMSSRSGNVIFLEDVLSKAVDMVREVIAQKNPDLPNRDLIAEQVGVGAVIFNDLMNDRVKNVEFDWAKILDFEGDSGPYVQYCYVRCNSVIKKAGRTTAHAMSAELTSLEEQELIRHLLNFPHVVATAFDHFKPHVVATYLLDICRLFGQFYTKHRILGEPEDVLNSRLALVEAVQKTIRRGLEILNIQAPEAM